MPSNRRLKYFLALVALVVIITLYYSSEARQTRNAAFYKKTEVALEKAAEDKRLKAQADAKLEDILKHAKDLAGGENVAEVAKASLSSSAAPVVERAKKIPPPPPGSDGDVDEMSVAGRKMMPKPKPWAVGKDEEVALNGGRLEQVEEPGIAEAETELNNILKKSPLIIFSKSGCPYSRRAKSLLLDTYKIVPAPYVVELDLLTTPISDPNNESPPTLGRKLQDLLAKRTGRKTVPNVLINGRSIGGSDDLAKLDADDELVKKIREMGGRWVHEVERRGGPAAVRKG